MILILKCKKPFQPFQPFQPTIGLVCMLLIINKLYNKERSGSGWKRLELVGNGWKVMTLWVKKVFQPKGVLSNFWESTNIAIVARMACFWPVVGTVGTVGTKNVYLNIKNRAAVVVNIRSLALKAVLLRLWCIFMGNKGVKKGCFLIKNR